MFGLKGRTRPRTAEQGDSPTLQRAADLIEHGDSVSALVLLQDSGDLAPDQWWRVLALRHAAFQAWQAPAVSAAWPMRQETWRTSIPELDPAGLTTSSIGDAVFSAGALVVRGLLSPAETARLRDAADRALAVPSDQHARAAAASAGWRHAFEGANQNHITYCSDVFLKEFRSTGALMVDSPALLLAYLDVLKTSGLTELIRAYLGGSAAFTAQKAVLRRVPPDAETGWHQDGAFLGTDSRALNLWITLSDCGVTAPGIDLIPVALADIVERGTNGARFDWSVGDAVVDRIRGRTPIVRNEYRPGDAVLFDQFNLHSTATADGMTRPRYALECWFFDPGHFPSGYTGLLL